MEIDKLLADARDAMDSRRVFGKPYEKGGVTVITAAKIQGGAGGGSGESAVPSEQESDTGTGVGFGISAKPVGAFVIRGETVRWYPTVDVNRIVLGAQVVAAIALLTLRSIISHRTQH